MAIRSDVVSDGELRRYAFFGHLVDAGLVTTKKERLETMEGNAISPERRREKLARVAETARLVRG